MNASPRLVWIDALKGVGIVLVASAHHPALWACSEALGRAIFSFSMPLFFFITGLTLNHGMSFKATSVRALSSLIPYFTLSCASFPLIYAMHSGVNFVDVFYGVLYGTGHTIFTVPLWFLPCLALTLVIVYLADRIELLVSGRTGHPHALTQVALFISLQLAWQLVISNPYALERHIGWGRWLNSGAPWSAEVALVGASYVILGRLFSRHIGNTPWMAQPRWIAALLIAVAFVALNLLLRPAVDLNWRYDRPFAWTPVIAMSGIAASVLIAASLRNRKVLELLRWLGTSTILILWLHATLEKASFKLLEGTLGGPGALLVSLAIALLVPAFIASALKRFPRVYALIAPNQLLKGLLTDQPSGRVRTPQASAE
jgi:fucose 4-O-acetylase-like acetyltransferase